MVFAQPELSLA
jgi:hypothetical protein